MNIFELANAIGRNENCTDSPSMDAYWIDVDALRRLQTAYGEERFSPLVVPPEMLIPCTYRGRTYLMDTCANLWHFDVHSFLSPVSVGYCEYEDGVVTDLLAQDDLEPEFREHLQQYLKQPESE